MTPAISLSWGLLMAIKVGLSAWAFRSYVQRRGLEDEFSEGVRAIPGLIYDLGWLALHRPGGGG